MARERRPHLNRKAHGSLTDFMVDPDVASMLAFQRGDYDAFQGLVERHTEALVSYFFFQSRDRQLAEDCSQDVWLKVFKSRDDYQPRARFRTFLFRVARNHWIDRFRTRARRPRETPLEGDGQDAESGGGPLDRLPAGGDDPDARVRRSDAARTAARALQRLPEEMREVYILAEVEELPYAEVADVLRIPLGTVKSRMFNAVRKLQEITRGFDEET